jgi:hypothetical protein
MAEQTLEERVQELQRQATNVEQILPTLATKDDVQAVRADLHELRLATKGDLEAVKTDLQELRVATKADLESAKAELRTEIQAEGERTRRHFDVVAESTHADIRLIAEGLLGTQASGDARHADTTSTLEQHDRRLTRLEALALKRR